MKKKIVGIFVCMLMVATAVSAVGTMNDKENLADLGICSNSLNEIATHNSITDGGRGSLFMQLPQMPCFGAHCWESLVSDVGSGATSYDDFWNVTSPICDVHWWGQCAKFNGEWYTYDPAGMTFKIEFYADDNGKPGTLLYSYDSLIQVIIKTGIMYYAPPLDKYFELYYFEIDLDPCCEVLNGWITIQSTYCPSGGWFIWINSTTGNNKSYQFWNGWIPTIWDLSFILTDGEPTYPDLECEGSLNWEKVKTKTNVTGSFKVRNNGNADSILNWNISSYPSDWGTNWTFIPKASVLTTDMGWITIEVNVTAPEKKGEFTGKIKVVNAINSSDYCEIDVYLKTPRSKLVNDQTFFRLLERFQNIFLILQYLLSV